MGEKESMKICRVCGDKALVRNFCVLSCESCKVFFRRNALKIESFKCNHRNDCVINLETRKRCRKCRIDKCFKVGMKKECILDDETKKQRNDTIEENRKKRLQNNELPFNSGVTLLTPISDISDREINSVESINMDKNLLTEDHLSDMSQNSADFSTESLPLLRPLTSYIFTKTESSVFNELIDSMKCLNLFIPSITSETTTFSEAMRVLAINNENGIREAIKTFKSLPAFKNICGDDQYLLLKFGILEILMIRTFLTYEKQNECLIVNLDKNNATKLNLQVFKQNTIENYVYVKFCIEKFVCLCDYDQSILNLMVAILLFMPTRPQLTNRSQIRLQQQVYIHLLKRYLQLKYGSESESKKRFSKLIELISDLNFIHETQIRKYYESMPSNYISFTISPLLKEIYYKNECLQHSTESANESVTLSLPSLKDVFTDITDTEVKID